MTMCVLYKFRCIRHAGLRCWLNQVSTACLAAGQIVALCGTQVPADSYMQTGRQQAHAELAAIQRSAMAAKVEKSRAKAADTRAARLDQQRQQQNGGVAVSCSAKLLLHTCCLFAARAAPAGLCVHCPGMLDGYAHDCRRCSFSLIT